MPISTKMRSFLQRSRPSRSNSISSLSSIGSYASASSSSPHLHSTAASAFTPSAYPLPPRISITDYEASTRSLSPPSSPRTSSEFSRPGSSGSASKPSPAARSAAENALVTSALTALLDSHLPLLEEHYVNLLALSSYPPSLRSSPSFLSLKSDTVYAVSALLAEMEGKVRVLDDAGLDGEEVVGELERRMEGLVGLVRGMGRV